MTKILFLAANPNTTSRLRLDQEIRDIEEGLRRSQYRNRYELIQRWAVRPRDIQRAMLDEQPQIVHFSGHGEGKQGLVFEDETGNPKLVSGEALAALFELFVDRTQCVVLNGCFSEFQARAIVQNIDYVIGMNQAIADKAAIDFAVGFYDALGAGENIEFAFKLGCTAMQLNSPFSKPISTRKLVPVDELEQAPLDSLIPVLFRRLSLSKQDLKAAYTSTTHPGGQLDRSTSATDLLLKGAEQAHLEDLKKKLSELASINSKLVKEENKLQTSVAASTREALEWLNRDQETLSQNARAYVEWKYRDTLNFWSAKERDDFQWEIKKYIELVYYSVLSGSFQLLDEPTIPPSILAPELYSAAFDLIKKKIPDSLAPEARATLSNRFDYLFSRLFISSPDSSMEYPSSKPEHHGSS